VIGMDETKQEMKKTLSKWIEEECEIDYSYFEKYRVLHEEYKIYLRKYKKRLIKIKIFKKPLQEEGLFLKKTAKKINGEFINGNFIEGIRIKK
jgi:hypothetical protein